MSSVAWGLLVVLLVSTVFGSVRMYVLMCIVCVLACLSVGEVFKNAIKVPLHDEDESSVSKSEDEVSDEDVAKTSFPFSSTPSKSTTFHPVKISTPYAATVQPELISDHNADIKHMDSVECRESNDVCTSITTRHSAAMLDDSHTIQDATSNGQNIDNQCGSHDQHDQTQRGSKDQKGSHDHTDFAKRMRVDKQHRRVSFRTYNNQKKRQLISQIFIALILICIVTLFYRNPWLAFSLLLPITCTVFIRRIVLINFVYMQLQWAWLSWKSSSLCNVVFPPLVCHVYNSYAKLDKKVTGLHVCV